jgi:Endonuclease-reverse transcriptase
MIEMIQEAIELKTSHLLILGDLNYPGIDCNLQTSSSSCEWSFLDSLRDWLLWQHTTQPTRYRVQQKANILDLAITNVEGNVKKLNMGEPVGKRDHVMLN